MKKDIHPKYNPKAQVTCACGNKFEVGSTQDTLTVEICSVCHPFWTGEERFIDVEGRVDKFKRKQDTGQKEREKRIKEIKKKLEREKQITEGPKSLKDMLKSLS